VPRGYTATVLLRWGDGVGSPMGVPSFRMDASNSAAEQALQCGMHNDGMQFYSLPFHLNGANSSRNGLLVLNHEYFDPTLLHVADRRPYDAERFQKELNAVGVSVVEVEIRDGKWVVVRPSRFGRRITASTRIALSGPAAGTSILSTELEPTGRQVFGTFAGCAHGRTPWGTYLTCEENFHVAFVNTGTMTEDQRRYEMPARLAYNWPAQDERFNAARHPNEFHRFGWVVEIDPFEPDSQPVKRTALGRFAHEGAALAIGADRRLAFYMSDDKAFEYIYKFVTHYPWDPTNRAANRDLLDHGYLYVARFNADGTGDWLPLIHGSNGLTKANGFLDQAEVLVRSRQAADQLGATKMDRPEWCAVHPVSGEVYCTLTNNELRGAPGRPGIDRANPREGNPFGHIIRWREVDGAVDATRFSWDIFAMGGEAWAADPANPARQKGDSFGSPDGLYFDGNGMLWVMTDVSPRSINSGPNARFGNNQMLAVDPKEGTFKRFLVGPRGAEITGLTGTPDGRTFFVNIQHPGEGPQPNTPDNPRRFSNWPDFDPKGRPRSATVVIRKDDGGVIGS
jgi:uncharacterized protein